MSVAELLTESRHEASGLVAGVAAGTVSRNDDPDGLARVKLKLPWRGDDFETDWVRIVAPMAGGDRGAYFVPEVGDEVLVAFDRDDIRYPYVLGGLWSRTDQPPEKNSNNQNDIRIIKTRKGHILKFDDGAQAKILIQFSDGKKKITIDANGILIDDGQNKVTLDANAGSVTVEAAQSLSLKAPKITIEASMSLDIKGGQSLSANATMVRIN
jgi:uncharacterized protein involved in type VI secretion and phage assembly